MTTPVLVQSSGITYQGSGGNLAVTLASAVTAGNAVVALYGSYGSSGLNSTVVDSNGTIVYGDRAYAVSINNEAGIAYVLSAAAGTHQVTLEPGAGTGSCWLLVMEWSGLTAYDTGAVAQTAVAVQTMTSDTLAPAQNLEIVFVVGTPFLPAQGTNAAGLTDPPAGYTSLGVHQQPGMAVEAAYAILTAGGNQSATWNWTYETGFPTSLIAAFEYTQAIPAFLSSGVGAANPVAAAKVGAAAQVIGAAAPQPVGIDRQAAAVSAAGVATMTGAPDLGASALAVGVGTVSGVGTIVSAAAAYSAGFGEIGRLPTTTVISGVLAGATVAGATNTFTSGQSATSSVGVGTVKGAATPGYSASTVAATGAATMRAQTPDLGAMGVGAAQDSAAVTSVGVALVTGVGAGTNPNVATAAFASAGVATVTGVGYQSVNFYTTSAAYSDGFAVVDPVGTSMHPGPKATPGAELSADGGLAPRRKIAADKLTAQDEAEVLSLLPHLMSEIHRQSTARRQ